MWFIDYEWRRSDVTTSHAANVRREWCELRRTHSLTLQSGRSVGRSAIHPFVTASIAQSPPAPVTAKTTNGGGSFYSSLRPSKKKPEAARTHCKLLTAASSRAEPSSWRRSSAKCIQTKLSCRRLTSNSVNPEVLCTGYYGAVLPRRRPHYVSMLSVCLSVRPVPPPRGKTKRPTNTKLGRKDPRDTSTLWTNFKVKGSKVKVTAANCVVGEKSSTTKARSPRSVVKSKWFTRCGSTHVLNCKDGPIASSPSTAAHSCWLSGVST